MAEKRDDTGIKGTPHQDPRPDHDEQRDIDHEGTGGSHKSPTDERRQNEATETERDRRRKDEAGKP